MGGRGASNGDIIPGFDPNGIGFGTDDPSLSLRGPNDGLTGPNTFNGQTMVPGILSDVYFGFDSSAISASERIKLQDAADYLMDNPGDNLLIQGHCDWYGTAEYNLALGDRRANSARDYLLNLGVSSTRVETLSKGSLEAISGLSKTESSQDRKAELIVLQ
jgi:peptidoglycan-associated lipoprotein